MDNDRTDTAISRRQLLRAIAAGQLATALPLASGQDPDRPIKRIYIAADDHTDYMWTADEETYRQVFLETIDHYLDLADQTDDRPEDFQSRWNCDGLLWFREYERNRSAAQVQRLVSRIKSGHVSVPMTMLVSCYGGTPTEAVLRGLYCGGHVERKYSIRLTIAVAMENQTLPYGLGMLWAGSGVRNSWKGICGCASKLKKVESKREHDVYWWVGPDGSRVLMKWYSIEKPLRPGVSWNEGPGGYAEARHPELAVEFVDTDPEFRKHNPHSVIGLFGQGWDDLKTIVPVDDPQHSYPVLAQRLSNPQRRVIVSNEHDYFADMTATHGSELPELSCAFGNEWELYSASMAEVSATVKRATEKLRTAESMAALVTQYQGDFAADLQEMREQAWVAFGLYWEHDWTADGPISRERRATWQRKIAKQIIEYVDTLYDRAAAAVGGMIASQGEERRIFVFNALAWKRTDYVDLPIDGGDQVTPVDIETGQPCPAQEMIRDGQRYLRILASEIPGCGYRVYALRPGAAPKTEAAIVWKDSELISPKHRLRLREDGAIDLWDSLLLDQTIVAAGQLANHFEAARGEINLESTGPVSTTVRVDIDRPTARTTRITMFESLDRIEIENTIRENFSEVETWRYEFNLKSAQTYHEEVGAIIRAASKSDGGDYADRHARTDWLTMNHFVTMHDDSMAVTLSNQDCLFFHLGEEREAAMDSASSVIQVLAGGQVDGPKLGISRQGGDRYFMQRFALGCAAPEIARDRTQSMRFALEHQNPLAVGQVRPGGGELHGVKQSMMEFNSDGVLVWAIKPAEDGAGEGTIVRLWNLATAASSYRLTMNPPVKRCFQTTHVETNIGPMEVVGGEVSETLLAGAMRTIRIVQ